MTTTAELIAGAGGTTATLEAQGEMVTGTIVATDVRQVTDFQTGKPETWDNGDAKMQMIITLQTQDRDASNSDDDGVRKFYIKWWGEQRKALLTAIRAANVKDIAVGGTFTAILTGFGVAPFKGANQPKLYEFQYVAPSPTAGLIQQSEPAPVTPAAPAPVPTPPVTPAPTPPPAPAAPAPAATPEQGAAIVQQIKALIAAGVTDEQIIAITSADLAVIGAIRNAPQ